MQQIVRWLLLDHVGRVLDALLAGVQRQAAYAPDGSRYVDVADRVARFRGSVPAPPTRRLISSFVLAVFLCAFVLANWVFRSHDQARALGDTTLAIATLDRRALVDAGQEFNAAQIIGAIFLCASSVALMLLLPALAYRVKSRLLRGNDAAGHDVYELEDQVFGQLGITKPGERNIGQWARVARYSLLVWAAFVLASFGVLLVTDDAPRVLAAAPFLVVAGAIIGSITADYVRRGRGGTRFTTARRRVVIGASAVALAFALVPTTLVGSPDSPPADYSFELGEMAVDPNTSYARFLNRIGVSTLPYTAFDLSRIGVFVRVRVKLRAPRDERVAIQSRLIGITRRSKKVLTGWSTSSHHGITRSQPTSTTKRQINPTALILGDFARLTKEVAVRANIDRQFVAPIWLRIPKNAGRAVQIEVRLSRLGSSSAEPLAIIRSQTLRLL